MSFKQQKASYTSENNHKERLALICHFPPPMGLKSHEKPYQYWGRLVLSGVLLRDQYHRGKGCQASQDAIKRRFNCVLRRTQLMSYLNTSYLADLRVFTAVSPR